MQKMNLIPQIKKRRDKLLSKKSIAKYNITIVLTLLITISILISACSMFPSTTDLDFREGTEGLSLEIQGPDEITLLGIDSNPAEMYEVQIENRGATTVRDGEIYLKISFPDTFLKEKDSEMKVISLSSISGMNGNPGMRMIEGKTRYKNEGDKASHLLMIEATPPPGQGITAHINADICYKYSTILSTSICLDTVPMPKGTGCQVQEYGFLGQGAPITISNVEVKNTIEGEAVNHKIVIHIENNDGIMVSTPENFYAPCTNGKGIGKIALIEAKLGNEELECELPDYQIDLKDDATVLICNSNAKISESPSKTIISPLYIELAYGAHIGETKAVGITRENYEEETFW